MLAFDNLSGIAADMSDALCQISTGGAHTARTLYSDDEETLLEAMKPIILNGMPSADCIASALGAPPVA